MKESKAIFPAMGENKKVVVVVSNLLVTRIFVVIPIRGIIIDKKVVVAVVYQVEKVENVFLGFLVDENTDKVFKVKNMKLEVFVHRKILNW